MVFNFLAMRSNRLFETSPLSPANLKIASSNGKLQLYLNLTKVLTKETNRLICIENNICIIKQVHNIIIEITHSNMTSFVPTGAHTLNTYSDLLGHLIPQTPPPKLRMAH